MSKKYQKKYQRKCKICGTIFLTQYNPEKYVNKYTTCSPECSKKAISLSKIKYSQEDINKVIELKKQKTSNSKIVELTGVKLSKVKEIVKKNKLYLTKEGQQQNAYKAKLEKNPDCMENMRKSRVECPTNEFNKKIKKITDKLKNPDNKSSIPQLSKQKELHDTSVRRALKLRKMDNLIDTSTNLKSADEIADSLIPKGYILNKETYVNTHTPCEVFCIHCKKTRKVTYRSLIVGNCPFCSNNGKSKPEQEQEIIDFIEHYLPNIELEHSNRTIVKPKEIDIYIPSLKLGIEYCGLYWHNELSPHPRMRKYHQDKMLKANEQGVRLITIFEDEWRDRQSQVKNFLKSVLGIYDLRVYARKCEVNEVDKKVARDFLNDHHIQGSTSFKIALGLYYNEELLGLVTGNVHHRQKEGLSPFVLNRLVFKNGCQVVGGSSKLLKYLIKYAKNQGYQKLISWSDNRISEGNVYKKLNFKLTEKLPPDYSYVTPDNNRQSKQSNKKKNLLKKGAMGTMENTERELALTLDLYRIWDCGKKRWEIDLYLLGKSSSVLSLKFLSNKYL